MVLDITNCFELQQLFLLDADSEAGVSFNRDFVKPQGVNPMSSISRASGDHCWISAGNAMQIWKAPLQLLLIRSSSDNTYTLSSQVPVLPRLSLAPVPAELLVDGWWSTSMKKLRRSFDRREVGSHQDFSDLVEILAREMQTLASIRLKYWRNSTGSRKSSLCSCRIATSRAWTLPIRWVLSSGWMSLIR